MGKNALSGMSGTQKINFWQQKLQREGYGTNAAVTAKYDRMAQKGAGQPKGKNGACPPYEALRKAMVNVKVQSTQQVDVKAQTQSTPARGFTLESTFEKELQASFAGHSAHCASACTPKPPEPKPAEQKPCEPKPAETKSCEPNPCETKPSQSGVTVEHKSELELNFNWASNKGPCPCEPPKPSDSCHPAGSLKTDAKGVITTPGGYKIEATGKHEFKISKDGKSTRVWGDPHVEESDGGKWDFKRASSFVLDDGTKIDVSTSKPDKNGRTYSVGLQVINGNDRVQVTDMDKGRGKVSQVTQDGRAHANDFAGKDVFKMGKDVDDWSFQGKEIIGSKRDGEEFKLGKALPGNHRPDNHGTGHNGTGHHGTGHHGAKDPLSALADLLSQWQPRNEGPFPPSTTNGGQSQTNRLNDALSSLREMFSLLSMLRQMTQLQTGYVRG